MKPHDHDDPKYPVKKSDAEWRAELDPTQYQVARHAATERPFTGAYWDHWDDGKYRCVGCGEPLFESKTKFDAGCGWPSYYEPVNSEVVERVRDDTHGSACGCKARTRWTSGSPTGRACPRQASPAHSEVPAHS